MAFKQEKYYLNGKKIIKQTLNKYIRCEKVLSAIKNGADEAILVRERLGKSYSGMICALKKDKFLEASDSTRYATYTVTPKGEELINVIKQYNKEKKNETI